MTRTIAITLYLLFCMAGLYAQNLVPNGSFEYHTTCPPLPSFTTNTLNWRDYHGGTTDLFDTCGGKAVKVPDNFSGYQPAADGHAYAGTIAYPNNAHPDEYTEYLVSPITPMSIGKQYEVSISVSLSDSSSTGCNGLGVWFYDNGPDTTLSKTTAGFATLKVTPQISYSAYGAIIDTANWVRLTGVFTADSAYDHIVIGKFDPPTGLIIANAYNKTGKFYFTYYYVDSVVVRIAPGITNNFNDSILCTGNTFLVNYSLFNGAVLNNGNIFSAELSDPTGSFASGTTIIGSVAGISGGSIKCVIPASVAPGNDYRIRIRSSNQVYISEPNSHKISIRSLNAVAHVDVPVCEKGTIHLWATASAPGTSYTWTGPNGYTSANADNIIQGANASQHNGKYVLVAGGNGCISTTSVDVKVTDTTLDLGPDAFLCMNESRLLAPAIPYAGYTWQDGSTAPEFNITRAGTYWVTVNTVCGIVSDTVKASYEICECQPFIPSSFTPNGDGLNDKFGVTHIDCNITRFKFVVVNRFGEVVFESTELNKKWDGTYKGQATDIGTYFYILQVTGPKNKQFRFKGDVTLIR